MGVECLAVRRYVDMYKIFLLVYCNLVDFCVNMYYICIIVGGGYIMDELIKWIIENKELVILACITISVSIPISIHFGKTIINNNNIRKNTTNNYGRKDPRHNTSEPTTKNKPRNTSISSIRKNIKLTNIRLYSTGKKGKVYTTKFYKAINHNFGVEITLKNNTNLLQNVKVGWCIYKNGNEIIKGTFSKKVNANSSLTNDFYVKEQAFSNLKVGKYKSQFWVNDQRVQKVYFTISNK